MEGFFFKEIAREPIIAHKILFFWGHCYIVIFSMIGRIAVKWT